MSPLHLNTIPELSRSSENRRTFSKMFRNVPIVTIRSSCPEQKPHQE